MLIYSYFITATSSRHCGLDERCVPRQLIQIIGSPKLVAPPETPGDGRVSATPSADTCRRFVGPMIMCPGLEYGGVYMHTYSCFNFLLFLQILILYKLFHIIIYIYIYIYIHLYTHNLNYVTTYNILSRLQHNVKARFCRILCSATNTFSKEIIFSDTAISYGPLVFVLRASNTIFISSIIIIITMSVASSSS